MIPIPDDYEDLSILPGRVMRVIKSFSRPVILYGREGKAPALRLTPAIGGWEVEDLDNPGIPKHFPNLSLAEIYALRHLQRDAHTP